MSRMSAFLGLLCLAFCGGCPAAGLEQVLLTASGGRLALLAAVMGSASAGESTAMVGAQEGEEAGEEEGEEEG
eukprot:CAMPEP_0204520402 /NCGR_PEP_ID=MMETSP0661-20131031/5246_1 /ASSEMBLY_ACC=CAM_ASM_000606 /TAXON_ID=109239 /ORGANISM="Alexandrium margalefi, Strain AMGDE01CS-322" /LENGTH=72 /DNA_ID=CAMNT_0051525957 /DNA_START=89 /DNA_END=307 /DNA_ORIENTATION=-